VFLAALGTLLAALPVHADGPALKPPVFPDIKQDDLEPERLAQLRLENATGSPALKERKNALMEQCWQMLERQSRNIGPVHVVSVSIIEEERIYINGKFVEPDDKMLPQTLPYECRVSADKASIDNVKVSATAAK
jgi:hypothetical protein